MDRLFLNNPAGCTTPDSYGSRTPPSSILATLLTAYSLGKSVRIYLNSTTCDPSARPLFAAVGVQQLTALARGPIA